MGALVIVIIIAIVFILLGNSLRSKDELTLAFACGIVAGGACLVLIFMIASAIDANHDIEHQVEEQKAVYQETVRTYGEALDNGDPTLVRKYHSRVVSWNTMVEDGKRKSVSMWLDVFYPAALYNQLDLIYETDFQE